MRAWCYLLPRAFQGRISGHCVRWYSHEFHEPLRLLQIMRRSACLPQMIRCCTMTLLDLLSPRHVRYPLQSTLKLNTNSMVTDPVKPNLWVSVRQRVNASHRQRTTLTGGWQDRHLGRVSSQDLYRNMLRDQGLLTVGRSLSGPIY